MGSLTQGVTVVTLSDDFDFPDEFSWLAAQQKKTYSITGALLVEVNSKQSGRSITLQAGDTYAWMTRSDVETLRTMAYAPDVEMSLLFRGVTYAVLFDFEAGAIEARPVADFRDPQSTDFFIVTLRFIVV